MLFFRKIGMLLDQSPWRMFLLFFLLIAAVKWPANAQLPVWDESVSIFPAGEYLANHQFNVAGMLVSGAAVRCAARGLLRKHRDDPAVI